MGKKSVKEYLAFYLFSDWLKIRAFTYCYVFFAHELNDAPNRLHRCLSSRFLFYLAELKEDCIHRKLESQTIMHEMLRPCKYFPPK